MSINGSISSKIAVHGAGVGASGGLTRQLNVRVCVDELWQQTRGQRQDSMIAAGLAAAARVATGQRDWH